MNHLARTLAACGLSLTLSALLSAQTTGQKPGTPTGGGSAGGSYRGPGDTVPGSRPGSAVRGPSAVRPDHGRPAAPTRPVVVGPRIPPPGAGDPWETLEETPNGRPVVDDETSWQLWWHYNRWAYLDVEQALVEVVLTGSGGFFLGRGEKLEGDSSTLRPTQADLEDVVFPALVRVLKEESAPADLVSQAMLAIAKVRVQPAPGKEGFSQVAARHLRHANQAVVERSVLALGVNGHTRFLRWLESILADEPEGQARLGGGGVSDRARAFAAYGLGLLAERSTDPVVRARVYAALSRALHGASADVQGAALVAMGHVLLPWEPLAADAAPALLLESRGREETIAEVLAFLEDDEVAEPVRAQAPTTLARLLRDAPEEVRAVVIEALLLVVDEQSKATRELQNGAVLALGMIGNSGELALDWDLRAELQRIATQASHHRLTRHMATVALAQVAARAGPGEEPFAGLASTRKLLLRQLEHSRGQTLCWNALALGILERDAALRGEMPSPEICGALRRMLERNRTPEVAGAAAIALGLIRDVESLPALHERMLETGESHVRGYTALALGMIGARSSVDGVQRVLEEAGHQPFALQQAAIGLALLDDHTTSSLLFSLFGRASDPEVQASIAAALGWLRDPRPIGPLADRLADASLGESGRTWTAVALGRICDFDTWPWVGRWSIGANYDARLSTLIDDDFESGLLDLP